MHPTRSVSFLEETQIQQIPRTDSNESISSEDSVEFANVYEFFKSDWFAKQTSSEQISLYHEYMNGMTPTQRSHFYRETKTEASKNPHFLSSGIYPLPGDQYILYDYIKEVHAIVDQKWLLKNDFSLHAFWPAPCSLLLHLRSQSNIIKRTIKKSACKPEVFLQWKIRPPSRSVPSLEKRQEHERKRNQLELVCKKKAQDAKERQRKKIEEELWLRTQRRVALCAACFFLVSVALLIYNRRHYFKAFSK